MLISSTTPSYSYYIIYSFCSLSINHFSMASFEAQKRAHAAIHDVKLGLGGREAVRKWDATRSYVNRRLAGVPTRQELNKDRQALSPLLEAQLAH